MSTRRVSYKRVFRYDFGAMLQVLIRAALAFGSNIVAAEVAVTSEKADIN